MNAALKQKVEKERKHFDGESLFSEHASQSSFEGEAVMEKSGAKT